MEKTGLSFDYGLFFLAMKKILFVTPFVNKDTVQSMCFAKLLMSSLEDQGLITLNLNVSKTANPLLLLQQIESLRSTVRNFDPDLTVANFGTFTGLITSVFARKPKVVIFRGSDLNPSSENMLYQLLQHVTSHAASFFADGIICVSQELRCRLLVDKPCAVLPSPTNLDLFKPMNQDNCRIELGWDLNKPIAIFFAYGERKGKGLSLARKVQAELNNYTNEVELKLLIDEVPLDRMPIFLNAADCLIFLSDFEGSPNLIRDACACNLPIVTVMVGDVSEVLVGIHPTTILERDSRVLTEAMVRISKMRMRSNGRKHLQRYHPDVIARKYIEFFDKLYKKDREKA